MENNNRPDIRYVYELPYFDRRQLCRILDRMDMWEELAGRHMNFDMLTIQELRTAVVRDRSPSDELLSIWGHRNHTVMELFVLLSEMQHYQAMMVLRPFVPQEYHRLIYDGEEVFYSGKRPSKSTKTPAMEAKNDSSTGQAARSVAPTDTQSRDKNMSIDDNNFNAPESNNTSHSKLSFLHGEHPQNGRKIYSATRPPSAPAEVPQPGIEAAGSPHSAHVRSSRFAQENKENNVLLYNQQHKMSNASDLSSVNENCGTIPHIEYQELKEVTQGWAKHNILGKGGFGTVFKGNWKNTQVAVKKIEQRGTAPVENNQAQLLQYMTELRILNSCRHDNILPLFGISMGGNEPCLVYQFMPNGSLEDRLLCRKNTPPLSWSQRHSIARGAARGIQFLHNNSKPFVHGDIKSANILLDVNFIPRIGDFGLARDGPDSNYTHMTVSRVHGTRPYLPDEFLRGKQFSTKVDTYSFGVVLFELATGLRAFEDSRPYKYLKEHVENCPEEQRETLIDKKTVPEDKETFQHLILLGCKCVKKLPKHRPKMEEVLEELEAFAARHQFWDRMQFPGSSGTVSPAGHLNLTIPSLHPIGNLQQAAAHNNYYFLPPTTTNSYNIPVVPVFPSLTPSPIEQPPSSLSPQPHVFQPISAAGMHSPHAPPAVVSHPAFPIKPLFVPSPGIEVSPPSQESQGTAAAAVAEIASVASQQSSSRMSVQVQELVPPIQENSERTESSALNEVDASVLLPMLTILGVGTENRSERIDTPPSTSCSDVSLDSSISDCSSMSRSTAQGKSLLFF